MRMPNAVTASLIVVGLAAAVVGLRGRRLLTNIFERKQEAQEPVRASRGSQRGDDRPRALGHELAARVRRLPADGRRDAHHASAAPRPCPKRRPSAIPGSRACSPATPSPSTTATAAAMRTCSSDQETTKRVTERPQPGSCLHCHASVIPTYRRLGDGDVFKGFEAARKDALRRRPRRGRQDRLVQPRRRRTRAQQFEHTDGAHPVGLRRLPRSEDHGAARHAARLHPRDPGARRQRRARCRTSRASSAGGRASRAQPYDPNADATRQEMRSFVCGQCHVEYYCGPKVDALLPLEQRAEGRADRELLRQLQVPRRPPLLRLEARRDRAPRC